MMRGVGGGRGRKTHSLPTQHFQLRSLTDLMDLPKEPPAYSHVLP